MSRVKLHQMQDSGNCYKVRLAAHELSLPLTLIDVDVLGGETRKPAFLAKNPNGRVPLLELEDGRFLPESNAILYYLAEGTPLLPEGRLERAEVLQWLFFEQYSHEPYIAVARFWMAIAPGGRELKKDRFPEWHERGNQALAVMDRHLAKTPYFVGGQFSIADIALYAYTHVASDGGFYLASYANIKAWLARVAARPRHIPLAARPL